jgi:hypothetical protein
MREIQEEFRTKKIEINANLSPDVKELLKCVLRRNPDQRPNIRMVLDHPALQKRVEEFNRPISEEQFALLITSYMQNCGMSNKRDHPDEIKKYKASHKEFEAEWFGSAGDSGGFFDDIPVQFPPANFHGPMPTPTTTADPGFFDNIPENLSFKKSRQGSYRGDRFKFTDPKTPHSQPGSSTRSPDAFNITQDASKKSDSFGEPTSQSSRGIVFLTSDPNNAVNSSRNIMHQNTNSQPGSIRNISSFPQTATSIQTLGGERKDDPPAVISVKKLNADVQPLSFPTSRPDPLMMSSPYPSEPSNPTPAQISQFQSPAYVPSDRKNMAPVSKFDPTSAHYADNKGHGNQNFQSPNAMPSFRVQSHPETQNYQSQSTQLKTSLIQQASVSAPHATQTTYKTQLGSYDQTPLTYVNYAHNGQSLSTNVRNPFNPTRTPSEPQSAKTIDPPHSDLRQSDTSYDEVRYFPYDIPEGNQSQVFNNLNEEFKRQEEKQRVYRTQVANTYIPTADVPSGIKKIQIDTRINPPMTPALLPNASHGHLPPLPITKKMDPNQVSKVGAYLSNNVTFVDHFAKPLTHYATNGRSNLVSTHEKKPSYESTGTMGANVLTRNPPSSIPTQLMNDPSRGIGAKFVDFQQPNSSLPATYQRVGYDNRPQSYSSTEPQNVLGMNRASSFMKVPVRQGSLEKRREFSAEPVRVFARQIHPTFHK